MSLLASDIRFARSINMADVAEGGGPPSAQLLPDGASNATFPDVSEDARTGGKVEVRKVFLVLRNTDRSPLLGANVIVSEPPDDAQVSWTLMSTRDAFSTRAAIVERIESNLTPGPEWGGYLLENHVAGMRAVQILQRPGSVQPTVNSVLMLVYQEGQPTERRQSVRVKRVESITRTFTDATTSPPVDFQATVVTCEITDPLRQAYPGSAPRRAFARQAGSSLLRSTVLNDAGTFYGATRLKTAAAVDDLTVQVQSIHSQLVPNSRTETPLLDQRPAAARMIALTDAIGTLEVAGAPHSQRIVVSQETQGYAYTFTLRPIPGPGTLVVSFASMGTWYTITDDGSGQLTGSGAGTVTYNTGSAAVTLAALPDVGSHIIATWCDTAPFTNRVPAGPVVLTQGLPEFVLDLTPGASPSGTTIGWTSGGVARTATVSAAGVVSGAAQGYYSAAAGKLYLRPQHMPDPGTSFEGAYSARGAVTQSYASVAVDGGGFAALALDAEPIPGTVSVAWYTAQAVSNTSGADLSNMVQHVPVPQVLPPQYLTQIDSSTGTQQVVRHGLVDDGAGGFVGGMGIANYSGKTLSVRLVDQTRSAVSYQSDYEDAGAYRASVLAVIANN